LLFAALPWTWFLVRDRHPVLDTIAIGLPVIVTVVIALGVLVAAARRRPVVLLGALSWFVFGVVTVVGPWVPQRTESPTDAVRVVAANVNGNQAREPVVAAELMAQDADVLVVSEINRQLDDLLSERFPHVRDDRGDGPPEVAVFSRLPLTDLGLPDGLRGQRGARVRVDGPAGPFVLYAMHLDRPRFGPSVGPEVSVRFHRAIVASLRDAAVAEALPVVVAGDLNLVDRSSGYRRLTGDLSDAMLAGWGRPTAYRPIGVPFLPRIDHVLMPTSWCSTRPSVIDLSGSDHRGVGATLGPCP
jgi:endonuclease/exonuclease/phosphatase (EEP) superfamily protein YafD